MRWPRRQLGSARLPAALLQLPESLGCLGVGFPVGSWVWFGFCFASGLLISAFLSQSLPFLALLPGT